MIMFFTFAYFSRAVKYYRLDYRAPGQITIADGFKPRGSDLNLLNHAVNAHPRGTLSGYVSVTDDASMMVREFYDIGNREMWLYSIQVNDNGYPSVVDGLRNTFEHVKRAIRVIEPEFPDLDIDTAHEHTVQLSRQYYGWWTIISLLAELETVLATYRVAIYQRDHVSRRIPLSAIQTGEQIELHEDGSYTVLDSVVMPYVQPAPAENFPAGATDASTILTPLTREQTLGIRALGFVKLCNRMGCSLQSLDDDGCA